MDYRGIIIEESLKDKSILKSISILSTKTERVTKKHQTPWLKQWTLHTVEIPEEKAEEATNKVRSCLESEHEWYADFKNDKFHYIVFKSKVFKVNRHKTEEYDEVRKYGITLGIPDYQLDFSPDIIVGS